jgi:putative hemolysin
MLRKSQKVEKPLEKRRKIMTQAQMTRDISYASSAQSVGGRALIRLLENVTGRLSLIRRAEGYERDITSGRSFWQVLPERFGLSLQITQGDVANIPADKPLILIANHPFGILDGLMMGHLLQTMRPDFRILANSVFTKVEELNRVILPISFDETREATRINLETRAEALRYLAQGGAIGVFPGGTVSTSARAFSTPLDPGWRNFTAKMIVKSGATVVPLFFEGHNSRLFQLASRAHRTLRLGLLIKEFKSKVDEPVRIAIGAPIPPEQLAPYKTDPAAMMRFLRAQTYALSPQPMNAYDLGYEFEARYKPR